VIRHHHIPPNGHTKLVSTPAVVAFEPAVAVLKSLIFCR
jgi:hypothetical protein